MFKEGIPFKGAIFFVYSSFSRVSALSVISLSLSSPRGGIPPKFSLPIAKGAFGLIWASSTFYGGKGTLFYYSYV